MTFCLHELAFNQEIQDKLREEIRETYKQTNGELTYDAIMGMKYMDKVLHETLRKYPPVPILNRVCSSDYTIPNTDIILPKGTKVFISALGIQRDEEYYPDPIKFDPERFSDENNATRPNFTFLPFVPFLRAEIINIINNMALFEILAGLTALLFLFVLYVKRSHSYWSRRKVPYLKPTSVFGNVENPIFPKRGLMMDMKACYDTLRKRKEKFGGLYFFTEPIFMPVDIDLIKNIMSKDFAHFQGHGFTFNEKYDPLSAHLFNLEGEKWRNMRVKLSPTFTSGKMKYMFKTLLDCGGPLIDHLNGICEKKEEVDIKEILACYTTDIIGSCAFGLECNSFKDPDAEFRTNGRKVFTVSFRDLLVQFLVFWSPSLPKYLPIKQVRSEIESFFINAVRSILDYRTTNKVKRNDFIQMFIEMQEKAKAEGAEGLTLNEIAAQAFVFFLAGFETSSTTMTFCLHELAFNQEVQDKLRKEIREAYQKTDGQLNYDAIMGMKYMDMVLEGELKFHLHCSSLLIIHYYLSK
ncbi:cytochrome p450 [Holotrichia oblita]|uniref:Cytochrome p450 n=1 Tax=Holotrichia oblita TaxID=644536 RepID=A0ACB9SXP6_HOLOL|nr:cytochrome p450 [Holotrichia oblita]